MHKNLFMQLISELLRVFFGDPELRSFVGADPAADSIKSLSQDRRGFKVVVIARPFHSGGPPSLFFCMYWPRSNHKGGKKGFPGCRISYVPKLCNFVGVG